MRTNGSKRMKVVCPSDKVSEVRRVLALAGAAQINSSLVQKNNTTIFYTGTADMMNQAINVSVASIEAVSRRAT